MEYSFEFMLEAARSNNSDFDGIFYMAVKSTAVYCLPSCKAKFPKLENILFFSSKIAAKQAGFRGCKRCKSAQFPNIDPMWYQKLQNYLMKNLDKKLSMSDLEAIAGVHYNTISGIYLKKHHLTPLKFFQKLKLDLAHSKVSDGKDYRDVAFELGYESISGFREAFSKQFGLPPGAVSRE